MKVFITCIIIIAICVALLMGILSGVAIIKVNDEIDSHNFKNLLIIYNIEE